MHLDTNHPANTMATRDEGVIAHPMANSAGKKKRKKLKKPEDRMARIFLHRGCTNIRGEPLVWIKN